MATEKAVGRSRFRACRYATGFPIRCTDAEKREIFARAERANKSASRFLVELGTATAPSRNVAPSPDELAILEALAVQLRRLGTNLTEIIRRGNSPDFPTSDASSDADLKAVANELRGILETVRERLA